MTVLWLEPREPAAIAPPLLELRRIRAGYDGIEVLHGFDLTVAAGSVVALLGPNGAGKTTALKVIAGQHPASSGEVLLFGHRVNGTAPDRLARSGVCVIPEGRGVFPNLTVRENLWMMTYAGCSRGDVEAIAYHRFPRLAERRDQAAGTLSGGEQQMLAMARGLATRPALLLLDELSMGLAPLVVEDLYAVVAGIAADGVSVVVVEQFADVVLKVADRAAVVVHGRVAHEGTPAHVQALLAEAYLGGTHEGKR
jgi:branched-chain amino acid transport system ATP-binding protein